MQDSRKKYFNTKWTSVNKVYGWRHFQVRNVILKNKKLELFAVCDKNINFIIDINDIKNKMKWLPGWKKIV